MGRIIFEKQDLTWLNWSHIRTSRSPELRWMRESNASVAGAAGVRLFTGRQHFDKRWQRGLEVYPVSAIPGADFLHGGIDS